MAKLYDEYKQITERIIYNRYRTKLKQQLINTKEYITYSKLSYKIYINSINDNPELSQHYIDIRQSLLDDALPLTFETVTAINRSRFRRAKNVKQKIEYIVTKGVAYFYTFTFDDFTLANTSEKTRRTYISRLLKDNANYYVANIDFGKEKGREHYHAISNALINQSQWNYGFIKRIPIGTSEKDFTKVSKYITKLTNHALKASTSGNSRFRSIIYSRQINML